MVKVLKEIKDNRIMIGFLLLLLVASIYMGMNERRLDDINNSNHAVIQNIK